VTINIPLSDNGIQHVIAELTRLVNAIDIGVDETIEILTNDGATIAQTEDGGMATVTSARTDSMHGVITASGDAAVIAEFGAGDATLQSNVLFENPPPVEVYPGSYSELVGTQEYFTTGKWHFGGKVYRLVEPRQGLYKAKQHIINNAVAVAKGAILI